MAEDYSIPNSLHGLPNVVVVCGHYGTGKTNLALNLAYDMSKVGRRVTVVDLDIVNPYFRSSDHGLALEGMGIELVCPQSAGTALDSPMLSVAIDATIGSAQQDPRRLCIVDAGGDDVGATALGRFAKQIASAPYAMFYVVNAARELTKTPQEAAAVLSEVEAASHLQASHLVNNTHLMQYTDEGVLVRGMGFARELSGILGLPIACTTVPTELVDQSDVQDAEAPMRLGRLAAKVESGALPCENPYFVRVYVRKPWDV